ncbi:hypothetical protein DM02DRAFT_608957 [Periconia macrospinosa]|uniref:Zn(2)-C6 fungal-type domain-containing protein n=1 Tax=Periconia macrospinosa TaxID=97972 RepID=A0A2V1EA45_9PLEO|nr:hypothetical protein DM02DRAFT_608957 [Periconia macrospinosa]
MDQNKPITKPKAPRIARACDVCYSKKIKCDAGSPRCNWCAHQNLPCTYERRVVRRKSQIRKDERTQLLDRVDRLEKLLVQSLSQNGTSASPPDVTPDSSFSHESPENDQIFALSSRIEEFRIGQFPHAAWRLGAVNPCNGIPIFSEEGQRWMSQQTGDEASTKRICEFSKRWHQQARSAWSMLPSRAMTNLPNQLPPRHLVEEYLDLYHRSYACHAFPVVDPLLFRGTINVAYRESSSSTDARIAIAQACIYAFLAFVACIHLDDDKPRPFDMEEYAQQAHIKLVVYCVDVCVETLQTSVILQTIHVFLGQFQYALYQASISARMIYVLGAHLVEYPDCRDPDVLSKNIEYRQQYLLRNLFWVCNSWDKELCIRTGQPPTLQDEHCNTTLPPLHAYQLHSQIMGYNISEDEISLHMFHKQPRLTMIKSKVYSFLYSAQAATKSVAELLKAIRELDDDLERWRLSVCPTYRPTVSFDRDNFLSAPEGLLSVMLHLDYNYCVGAIHKAASQCKLLGTGDNESEFLSVESSLALSVEASRSSLLYLQMANHVVPPDAFWMLVYYPIFAALSLFYNILNSPLHQQSLKDLELLSSVADIIREWPMGRMGEREKGELMLIDEMVRELTQLGQSAVSKAAPTQSSSHTF